VIKSQIDVAIILSFDDVLETNDVLVAGQGLNDGNGNEERERRRRGRGDLEIHNLTKCSLRISRITKCIKTFL
jgi:allantoicase